MADKKFISSFLVLWLLAGNHSAAAETLEDGFYSRSSEGWFFYNEEQEPEEEEIEQEEPVMAEIPAPEPTPDKKEAQNNKSALVPGSIDWLKKNLPVYLSHAVNNPTQENIKAYLFLQKMMTDKIEKFSNEYNLAVLGDPLYDDSIEQSETYAVNRLKNKESEEAIKGILKYLSSNITILYIMDDSPFSLFQVDVIQRVVNKYGFQLHVVSVSPTLENNALPPGVIYAPGIDKKLNLSILPASLIVTKEDKMVPFLLGGAADEEFISRLIKAAYREHVIDEEAFKKTRILGIENPRRNLADVDFSKALKNPNAIPEKITNFGDNTVNFISPDVLLDIINAETQDIGK